MFGTPKGGYTERTMQDTEPPKRTKSTPGAITLGAQGIPVVRSSEASNRTIPNFQAGKNDSSVGFPNYQRGVLTQNRVFPMNFYLFAFLDHGD